ncbi:MAG TPA: aminotransferase class V-fold PLP-dependent enzyme [Gaiellaceae bacterium]|nr:aminotransferase class V-fold PLP-dependent enzyme [Gaiellaceae bacterium]
MLDRRTLLVRTGAALAAGGLGAAFADLEEVAAAPEADAAIDWAGVRRQFRLAPGWVHMSGLYLASHPAAVRRALARHRRGLDANPVHYLHERGPQLEAAVLRAAGAYLRARPADIALTDSTTMGLGLLYNGIELRAGQEALTTTHDFYATHEALRLKAARSGASVRRVRLYRDARRASVDEIVSSLVAAVGPRTRVIALTWVHSITGVKLPLARIARALGERRRDVLLCVDGVHGLGVENATLGSLGCDFFVAGCHKWLFGPRGTGLVWGRGPVWDAVDPTIPSFSGSATPGAEMTPGGFHSFEHRWALAEAFRLHLRIGKARVARRIHALNTRLKAGLASMPHVTLVTPQSTALSAGLVCFTVDRMSPGAVVEALRRRRVIATVTPYDPPYARLAPGLLNTPADVDRALRAVRSLR